MGAALGVAERLLALEGAVAALQAAVGALGGTAGAGSSTGSSMGSSTGASAGPGGASPAGAEQLADALGNPRLAAVLLREGYGSPDAVRAAADGEVLEIHGIGPRARRLIREKLGAAERAAAAQEEAAWT
jgi:hypothetical protein